MKADDIVALPRRMEESAGVAREDDDGSSRETLRAEFGIFKSLPRNTFKDWTD